MKKCILICNKESGHGIKDKSLNIMIKTLEKYGYETELYLTEKHGDATKKVESIDYVDLVLSIGGDGTFNEIVKGNYHRKEQLLISHIPTGTTNDIGHMLGLTKNMNKNLESILTGEEKQVDIGLINNEPFIYVAGFGKFINVPYETSRKLKKKLGHLAYLINGCKEFFQTTKLHEIEYKVNNEKHIGLFSLVLVSNANRIAGFNNIYRDVKLDDGKLEIVLCNISRRKDLVKSLIIMMTKGITNVPGLYCYKAKEIELEFKDKHKGFWTIDGEKDSDTKNKYVIKTDSKIKMLLPKKNLAKLFEK